MPTHKKYEPRVIFVESPDQGDAKPRVRFVPSRRSDDTLPLGIVFVLVGVAFAIGMRVGAWVW